MADQSVELSTKLRAGPARKIRKQASRLQRAGKISDYRFRKVIDHFVRDHTATEAARATGLSVNSAHALYTKLRAFFFHVGLFIDIYRGQDPSQVDTGAPVYEHALLSFHLKRYGDKRGFRSPSNEPHYHFAESCWRYDFALLMAERPSEAVYAMMQRHLLELIRLCGPIGAKPRNRLEGALAVMRQADERIEWLMRNAPGFREPEQRQALDAIRSIGEDSARE